MFIADFHIHSKYSMATSKACVPEALDIVARQKGLALIGTGDFTHPAWRAELEEKLVPAEEGLYVLKADPPAHNGGFPNSPKTRFVITGEISSIYKKDGRVRKVHSLIILPSLKAADALAKRLEALGNIHSDGRPILGLDSQKLLELTLDVAEDAIFVPAHIWTPHFSLFGAYSGFESIEECFGNLTQNIFALETGLSSDPSMNWRLSGLDRFTLISNSDAHSPSKLAREANMFESALSYPAIYRALRYRETNEFLGTIEFFPEEGKYHCDGHRNCGVCFTPAETIKADGVCPKCGKKLTLGVLHRIESLADRPLGSKPKHAQRFENLVQLNEVIAAATGFAASGPRTQRLLNSLVKELGSELHVLREASISDIEASGGALIAEAIRNVRLGNLKIQPGYDGLYGKINIL